MAGVCVCVLPHAWWLEFHFLSLLRALSVCITAVKWTLATKDVHGKRVGESVEEYASKHKHSRVGIYSKRISHLIKTSSQLPGGLRHTKWLHVKFSVAPWLKISVRGKKVNLHRFSKTLPMPQLFVLPSLWIRNYHYMCGCERAWYEYNSCPQKIQKRPTLPI